MSRDGYMKDPKGSGGRLLSALATAVLLVKKKKKKKNPEVIIFSIFASLKVCMAVSQAR